MQHQRVDHLLHPPPILVLRLAGKIISAVCHGPAGLVLAKGADGAPLIKGKKVTGFTNTEEEAVGKTKVGTLRQALN
jgi:putative intracellular protease/amidase